MQGINVVLVALDVRFRPLSRLARPLVPSFPFFRKHVHAPPRSSLQNELLDNTFQELRSSIRGVEFRKVRTHILPPPVNRSTCPLLSSSFLRVNNNIFSKKKNQIGVDLGTPGAYLPAIEAGTRDVDVSLVFNNAGYIVTGFFDKTCGPTRTYPALPGPTRPH